MGQNTFFRNNKRIWHSTKKYFTYYYIIIRDPIIFILSPAMHLITQTYFSSCLKVYQDYNLLLMLKIKLADSLHSHYDYGSSVWQEKPSLCAISISYSTIYCLSPKSFHHAFIAHNYHHHQSLFEESVVVERSMVKICYCSVPCIPTCVCVGRNLPLG